MFNQILIKFFITIGKIIRYVKGLGLKKILVIAVVTLALLATVASVYYYRQVKLLKTNPNLEAQKEVEDMVEVVGRLIELPVDDTPTVATVLDKEKLRDQAFFLNSKNGDKLLIYSKTMKAILYRPSTNKIIEVAPLYFNQNKEGAIDTTVKAVSSSSTEPKLVNKNTSKTTVKKPSN